MKCKKCNGTSIKSRVNYPHGRKSRPSTTLICKNCGSVDIESNSDSRRRGFKRR